MLGLFSGEFIFGGAYYWKEVCISKWVGLVNKNSLKHYENSQKQLALTGYGLKFERAYYRKDFASEILGSYFWLGLFFGGEEGGLLSEFYGILGGTFLKIQIWREVRFLLSFFIN